MRLVNTQVADIVVVVIERCHTKFLGGDLTNPQEYSLPPPPRIHANWNTSVPGRKVACQSPNGLTATRILELKRPSPRPCQTGPTVTPDQNTQRVPFSSSIR